MALAVVLSGGVCGTLAHAQDGGGGDRGRQRGGDRELSDSDRAAFRERMEQRRAEQAKRLQEEMQASDEDFAVLSPMIENIQQLQREANFGGRGFGQGRQRRGGGDDNRGGGSGGGPGGGEQIQLSEQGTAVRDASTALREALEDDSASADALQEKIAALREAKAQMNAQLAAAQDELRSVLVARQEAVLIVIGVLE